MESRHKERLEMMQAMTDVFMDLAIDPIGNITIICTACSQDLYIARRLKNHRHPSIPASWAHQPRFQAP